MEKDFKFIRGNIKMKYFNIIIIKKGKIIEELIWIKNYGFIKILK